MVDDPRYEVDDAEMQFFMQMIAAKLREILPEALGFNLVIFELNKADAAVFFISTAERQDTIKVLTEVCNRYRVQ